MHLHLSDSMASKDLRKALKFIKESAQPDVDNLKDWLLVSSLSLYFKGDAYPDGEELLIPSSTELGITIGIAKAAGHKCERCWHYETDIGDHAAHPTLCGRCVAVLAQNPLDSSPEPTAAASAGKG